MFLITTLALAQVTTPTPASNSNRNPTDPGVRGGPPGAGKPFATGLSPGQMSYFLTQALPIFSEAETVPEGLGPRFNLDSCAGCHAFPAPGGSSPPNGNPQYMHAAQMAPRSQIPSFIKLDGPVREVRMVKHADGSPDGGVADIFTITGRSDAPHGCSIQQPDFSNRSNMIFRVPTPVFGGGLIESITDSTIRTNLTSSSNMKRAFGISGHVNTTGNDGTVTRFGWKAQNKSLLIFAAEAYNVEMGVTSEGFPNEREEDAACATNGVAEDHTNFDTGAPSDLVAFTMFMRFLDQPAPACGAGGTACSASVNNGSNLFNSVGCALCHTPVLMTGASPVPALSHVKARLYSDLAVHNMGTGLADNVTQGNAGPDEFRTAPLWGLGQRAYFLHDGRTMDLLQAILAHSSSGSEANRSINMFQSLSNSQQQDILNFLRSL
ncbi:MAG TPA: di-heme oxidoredictase family protein [Bryobacteraceae bacterium]|nr:di-heme oxidoredictase family protein [Bryobacteraceae bacterium]